MARGRGPFEAGNLRWLLPESVFCAFRRGRKYITIVYRVVILAAVAAVPAILAAMVMGGPRRLLALALLWYCYWDIVASACTVPLKNALMVFVSGCGIEKNMP